MIWAEHSHPTNWAMEAANDSIFHMVLEQLDARRQQWEGGGTGEELWCKSHTLNKNELKSESQAKWKTQTTEENLHGLGLFRQEFPDMTPKTCPGHKKKLKQKQRDSNLFRKLLNNQKDNLQPGRKILANPIYDQGVVYTYIKNLQNTA